MSAIIPLTYRVFFLYIEPIVTIAVACYAALKPSGYLGAVASSIQHTVIHTNQTKVVLEQLGNVYLFMALNEYFVLSSTRSTTTWKRLLLALLIADCGHLVSMRGLGVQVYWNIWEWNVFTAASVLLVYFYITLRICFLFDVGMGESRKVKAL
ncbi:hypothetical protein CYLTODRAFT_453583 [Cylindrobasidium torrendii FP15055 ss-10]|uniref:DUF7704 domain-containing protein n=1 Tax=Cylindrobasidium torrendii FP15055 ss-10 TaxID=1314674 RepID=A0A0D7BFP4_9AGAR|nr:hypothetical protein CYLTODRAFT_453583 [Cylindrobasidium torrendii FP15055 ss-10]